MGIFYFNLKKAKLQNEPNVIHDFETSAWSFSLILECGWITDPSLGLFAAASMLFQSRSRPQHSTGEALGSGVPSELASE